MPALSRPPKVTRHMTLVHINITATDQLLLKHSPRHNKLTRQTGTSPHSLESLKLTFFVHDTNAPAAKINLTSTVSSPPSSSSRVTSLPASDRAFTAERVQIPSRLTR